MAEQDNNLHYFPKELVGKFWAKIKSLVSTEIGKLSTVYAALQHQHTKSEISDLADATDTTGGLMTGTQAAKLAGIQSGAQVNSVEGIQKNGVDVAPDATSKKVNIAVPTKTSDLENDDNVVKDANYVHTDNNYDNTEKSKLQGIASGAQVNVLEGVSVNGLPLQVDANKGVNISVPTDNSSLTNGAGYQTSQEVANAIANAIAGVTQFDYQKVDSLPATGTKGVIYLIAHVHDGENDGFDEYLWIQVNGSYQFEKLGHTDVDLSDYVKIDDLVAMTEAELNEICV